MSDNVFIPKIWPAFTNTSDVRDSLRRSLTEIIDTTDHILVHLRIATITASQFTFNAICMCKYCAEPINVNGLITLDDLNDFANIIRAKITPCVNCDKSGLKLIDSVNEFVGGYEIEGYIRMIAARNDIYIDKCTMHIRGSGWPCKTPPIYKYFNNQIVNGELVIVCPYCGRKLICTLNRFMHLAIDKFSGGSFDWTCGPHHHPRLDKIKTPNNANNYNRNMRARMNIGVFDHICPHGHIFHDSRVSDVYGAKCYICEAFENITFFKLLDELEICYDVKGILVPGGAKGGKFKGIKLRNIIIYTKNQAGHLTGKIVFADPYYIQEMKADHNKLVFASIDDYSRLDDRQWCLNFFGAYFKAVNKKNNLKG